jgi:hypothetical protein
MELKRLKDLGETKGVAINRLLHESGERVKASLSD